MTRLIGLLLVAAVAAGCRTVIRTSKQRDATVVYVGDKQCKVFDYETAMDLPEGSKSLGKVQVRRQAADEATYLKLREKVCEMGGDAVSQMAWVKDAGEYEPSALQATAWVLP